MHPNDASARNLQQGATVKLTNDLGEVFLPLCITDAVRPGCVYSSKGAWFKTTTNQQTVSALAPQSRADLAEGACVSMTPGLRLQQRPTHSPDHHRRIVWRTEYHQDDIRVQQSVPLIQQFCIRIAKTPVVPEGIKTDQSISTFVIVRGLIKLTTGIGRS